MNKNLYRVVFNKARGLLMVVADIAGAGRAGALSSPAGIARTLSQRVCKVNGVSFALLLALGTIQPVQAGIIADGSAPGGQQPTIINSANGTPQVNIQTPSAAGVSRNVYSQFDVEKKGVVLNNSHANTQTQIAGMVNGNPWLAKGEARVILNEVNARNPSQLNGFIEVAGQKAQVVIANPSGITCNGCGFINANRATLTTGQAQMSNGQLTGYNIDRGEIIIQGNGLDSSQQDSTDLISRAVKVNAGIWANELNVTTGRNQVDATHQRIDKKADDGSVRPQLAVDVSQLGGMYANKIRLMGTESGVGVHNAGAVGASAGDVVVNADGTLTNSGTINASKNIQLAASATVNNQGNIYAAGNTDITSDAIVSNTSLIAAGADTRISAGNINSSAQSVLAAGVASDGKLASSGNLTLTSRGELKAGGQNMAGGQLSASATSVDLSGSQTYGDTITLRASHGDISTANGNLSAMHQLTVNTEGMLNNDGGKIAADQLTLTANRLSNQKGTVQQLGQQDLQLSHAGGINNREGTLASNSKNLTLTSATLDNQQGTILHAGDGQLTVNTGQMDGAQGTLVSNGALGLNGSALNLDNAVTQAAGITLNANTVSHHSGQMTQSGSGPMNLNVTGLFDNLGGAVNANGALSLNAAQLNNQQGQLIASDQNNLQLTLGGTLNNSAGIIAAGGNLASLSGAVDNSGGLIQSGAELHLNSRGAAVLNADSSAQGGIISAGNMQLATGDIDNHNGQIAAQSLTATTGKVNNQAGKWLAGKAIALSSSALSNQRGLLQSGEALTLNTHGQRVDNTSSGQIVATGALSVFSGEFDNQSGKVASGGATSLQTSLLNNNGGQISALGDLSLTNRGLQNNDGGLIQSAKNLLMDTQGATLSNNRSGSTGGITSQGNLTVKAGALDNQQGAMIGNGQMTLSVENVNNQQGQIVALGDIVAMSHALDNRRGTLQSGQDVQWNTQGFALDNRGGTLSAQNWVSLDTADFNNQHGLLASGGAMSLTTAAFDNSQQGQVASKGALSLTAGNINNQQGQIQSLGEMVLSAAQSMIDNGAGLIHGAANVTLKAVQVLNQSTRTAGLGIYGNTLTLNATNLDNSHGQVLADNGLNLNLGGELNNSTGLLSSQNNLNAQAQHIINSAGDIEAGKLIRLSGDVMTGDGKLLSLGDLTLNLTQDFLNTGSIQASKNLSLTTQGNLTNQSLIQAGSALTLSANNILNSAAAEINAGTTQVNAAQTVINYGLIDGFYTRINGQTVSNIGSGRIYGDALAIGAGTLNNLRENGQAATIAARQRLDIGAATINNRDHALIYSDGLMAVGGALNGDYQATGQAATLNNHSATLESAGDMTLNIASINNINDHFSLENVLVSQEDISEYEVSRLKNGVRYNDKDYTIYIYQDEVNILCIEGVICHTTDGDRFTHYAYTRTITEDRIKETDPAKIIAGGNLSINANDVLNDKSQIVAGGALAFQGTTVNNVEVEANRQTNDVGKAVFYSRHQSKGGDSSNVDTRDYVPPTVIQAITLKPSMVQEYTQGQGSGLSIADHQNGYINGNIQSADSLNIMPNAGPNAGSLQSVPSGAVTLPAGKTFEVKTGSSESVVRAIGPNTRLPDNSLFRTNPESTSPYLVETDPRFTDQKKWLGSDYMMDAFTSNADNVLKRLGDGYYEQRLIREQIIALTGQRYLNGAQSDEEQYKALMNEGIAFGKTYHLTPGVALTAEQMSHMTGDMVWLVTQTVQLADGSTQQVLVPQVYAMVQAGDVDSSGALLAGKNVSLKLSGDLTNSGRISGQQNTQILADNINNLGGIIQGNDVAVQARTDINNVGGLFSGNNSLSVLAGRDINAFTTTRSAESAGGDFARHTIDRVAGFYVQQPDGTLALQAGRDVNLTGAQVINSGNGGTSIVAARDINLNTVATGSTDNLNWGDNWLHQSARQQVGSEVAGAGDVQMVAGNNVTVTAGNISASQQLSVAAGNDISIQHGTDTETFDQHYKATGSSSVGSKTTTEVQDSFSKQIASGSQLSGDSVNVQAGHDLTVTGSNVVGTQDVTLAAGNNLNIQAATTEQQESHLYSEKKSGLSGTGGIGFSIGTSSLKTTDDGKTLSSTGSTIGSTQSNVNLTAGNGLTVKGSDVLAGKDLSLIGKEVNILAAENQSSQTHTVEQKQSGLTLALSGTVGSAINTAVSSANDASKESNGRLAALQGIKAALNGVQAAQAASLAEAGGSEGSMIGVNLSYGSQSSKSTQTSTQNQSQGTTLTAGNNLNIHATGTDINVQGSQLQAGKDLDLSAARDVNLSSGLNSQTLEGKNESHGASVGVGINFGQGANGLSLNASVNKGTGSESGNGTSHAETTLNAGNNLSISSGRDTTLTGAQASGEKVTLDVGRNLTLTSEQDTDNYDSKQQNASAGGSVSMSGGSGSVNLSRDKMHSTYESVQEQTGIFAGKGGFDITAGEHTQLNGAVIGSAAEASLNTLDTGTLGFSDIHNSAEYEAEHQSVGISSGGSIGGQFAGNMASGLLVGVDGSGSDSSTTKSAVSDGTITIRDKDSQKQDVDELSRDVEHANQTLSPIFDKEKEQNRLKEAQLIGDIGGQAADIARTQGQIIATKAANEKMKDVTPDQLKAAEAGWRKANPDKEPTSDDISSQAYQNFYNQAFTDSGFGTGGKVQQAIQAATAAVQGLAGGDIARAAAGGAAPYIANIIGSSGLDDAGKVLAHAAVNAALATAQGNNALVGAAGAATAEMMGMVALNAYGKPVSELSETEKQTVSALATLAAGLAGGLTGDGTADAVAAAQAGKTTVENNFLSAKDVVNLHKELEDADKTGADKQSIYEKHAEISKGNREEAVAEKCSGNPFCANGAFAELQSGSDIANSLKRLPLFSDLSSEDLAQLDRFVLAENEDSARAIYQAMPDYVKVALNGKEAVEAIGLGAAVGGKALAALGVVGKAGKQPHQPNQGAVGNMGEFFKQSGFGSELKDLSKKTSKQYQGQSVYKAENSVGDYIKRGDQFYLDAKHRDHIEVFDSTGTKVKAVLNLDGSYNQKKTEAALKEGRRLPK
ncbi:hemagglutinin repeat-containing protein [Pantoea agglomerans]|uniref:hemagglutinin repeat-containing protein n=1 Tax=Enterobacter agglomerans TaxID=549 RepID=UPI003DA0CD9D